jgi:hypothetical protein
MNTPLRSEAQQRADEIAMFRGAGPAGGRGRAALDAAQAQAVRAPPRFPAGRLRRRPSTSTAVPARQLSLGMRVASFLGALALAASVFFLFYQFWGHFARPAQVAILLGAALGSLGPDGGDPARATPRATSPSWRRWWPSPASCSTW